jgi:hypothetical protein
VNVTEVLTVYRTRSERSLGAAEQSAADAWVLTQLTTSSIAPGVFRGRWAIQRCNCGHPSCDRWTVEGGDGLFYQGTGYPKRVAEAVLAAVVNHPALIDLVTRVAKDGASNLSLEAVALLAKIKGGGS